MTNACTVRVNGRAFKAEPGAVLLDAALLNGIDIPHDCRSGHCGTCQVDVVAGHAVGSEGVHARVVRACQSRVLTDLSVTYDVGPQVRSVDAEVTAITDLTEDVAEVTVIPARWLEMRPGQYLKVMFAGLPERCYSPTARLDGHTGDGFVRFHIKRVRGGKVSSALGREIQAGHQLRLTGPFGAAYFRPRSASRLVLIAGGTGFAPIWAIACAAMTENCERPMAVVAGARAVRNLYMAQAMELLAHCRNVTPVLTTEEPQSITPLIGTGTPAAFMPALSPSDVVYAAGPPALVDAVADRARRIGAKLLADPFVPAAPDPMSALMDNLRQRAAALGRPRDPRVSAPLPDPAAWPRAARRA